MKYHIIIIGTAAGEESRFHFFVEAKSEQEAARQARWCFVEDHYKQGTAVFVRVVLVEPDTGVLML